jgi:DNA-binding IclR family transcriptional regulator
MTRRSPPTERVIRLLELFAASPGEPITFSEIARRVDITKATCHALLLTLTEAGYLIREPRAKTYTLGPALIELGDAARSSFPSVQRGHAELELLGKDTGFSCLATAIVDDDLLIVDRAGAIGPDHSLLSGRRIPFRPPFGATAVAWAGDGAVTDWIERSAGRVTPQHRDELLQVVEDVRSCGYAVFPLDEAGTRFRNALSELADDVLSDDLRQMAIELLGAVKHRDYLLRELGPNRRVPVDTITAPVFGPNGQPDYLVCVQLVQTDVPTSEIKQVGETLLRATARMTHQAGGTLPKPARSGSRARAKPASAGAS